tara:strand:+ start:2789 stop:3265 length:477 start_codon:yes stop_codon:yes gene_type:complete
MLEKKQHEVYIQNFREKVIEIENKLLDSNEDLVFKGNTDNCPLTHSFSEGVYIREMAMAKGTVIIGAIHNISHTWFLMKGSLIIATEDGVDEYEAPIYFNAKPGHKRILRALTDSIFINVHPNPDNITDTDELEKILTSKSYENYENMNKEKQKELCQ